MVALAVTGVMVEPISRVQCLVAAVELEVQWVLLTDPHQQKVHILGCTSLEVPLLFDKRKRRLVLRGEIPVVHLALVSGSWSPEVDQDGLVNRGWAPSLVLLGVCCYRGGWHIGWLLLIGYCHKGFASGKSMNIRSQHWCLPMLGWKVIHRQNT